MYRYDQFDHQITAERVAQFCKRQFWRGGQQRHDRQPPLFVDGSIDLEERFGIHTTVLLFSV